MRQFHGLPARALFELLRYDLLDARRGYAGIQAGLQRLRAAPRPVPDRDASTVIKAVELAAALYWKPVKCLQRSVAATRLLRQSGISCQLVVGYRPTPFFSHAWVEIEGRVINDAQGYKSRMQVLHVM